MSNNEFLQNYIVTKISGEFLDNYNQSDIEVLKLSEKEGKLFTLSGIEEETGSVYYSMNKIKYQDQDSALIIFSIELNGSRSGTSKSGKKVINVLDFVCKSLYSVDYQYCNVENIESKKSIALLRIIKIIREADLL